MKKHFLLKLFATVMLLAIALTALVACDAESLKVTFMLDEQEVYKVVDLESGDVVKLPEEPTKDGFVFDGWYLDRGTWEKQFLGKIEDPTVLSIVVYVKWTEGAPSGNPPSENPPSVNPPSGDLPTVECKHNNTNAIELSVDGCDHNYLLVCADCGMVTGSETVAEHTWSEEPNDYKRESCLVGAHTAIYCTTCAKAEIITKKADTIKYKSDEDGKCYPEHKSVKEVTYLDNEYECVSQTVTAKICTDPDCSDNVVEVIKTVKAPGHAWSDWNVSNEDKMPDGKTEGILTRTCSLCANNASDLKETDYKRTIPSLKITKIENGQIVATEDDNLDYYKYKKGTGKSCSGGRDDEYSFTAPDGKTIVIELNVRTNHYLVVGGVLKEINAFSIYCTADFEVGQLKVVGGPERETCSYVGTDGYCICDECGAAIAIKVRNEHEAYDPTKHVAVDITEATCTMQGYLRYTCTLCAEYARAVIPALGHNWMFCSFATATDGELTLNVSCNRCSESQVITATAEVVAVAPTCTEYGYSGYTNITTKDGFVISEIIDGVEYPLVIKTEAIPALGHKHETLGRLTSVDLEKAFDIRETKYANAFTALGDIVCGSTAETAVPGYFVCSECADSIRVKLYKSHIGDAKVVEGNGDRAATCTEAGQMTIDGTCTDCGKGGLVFIPALGHAKVYTCNYDEESEKWTVSWRCEREGCTNSGVLENVKDVKITSKSTCIKNGSAVVSFTDDADDKTVELEKVSHKLHGKEMVIVGTTNFTVDKDDPDILYGKYGVEDKVVYLGTLDGLHLIMGAGMVYSCANFDSDSVATAWFECDICADSVPVYVGKAHTLTYDNTSSDNNKAATCTENGHVKASCKNCDYAIDEDIAPLGHDVVVTVANSTVKFTCKRAGCQAEAIEKDLPSYKDVFKSVGGELVAISNDTWKVELISSKAATCTTSATYKLTLKKAALESLIGDDNKAAWINEDVSVSIEVVMFANHDISGNLISWSFNGENYIGYICKNCGTVIPC